MDKQTVIIADMIRSALAWEEQHGIPQHDNHNIEPEKPLTVVGDPDTLNSSENRMKGANDEYEG